MIDQAILFRKDLHFGSTDRNPSLIKLAVELLLGAVFITGVAVALREPCVKHLSANDLYCLFFYVEMPMDAEIIKDPLTGKVYMKTKSGRLMEIKGDVDVFVDPKTGKTYVMQKGEIGNLLIFYFGKISAQFENLIEMCEKRGNEN